MWRKGNPCALSVGIQFGTATMENSLEGPQKVKNGTALQSSNFTSENMSEETRNTNLKEYMHPCAHCSAINNCQDLEAAQVPHSR